MEYFMLLIVSFVGCSFAALALRRFLFVFRQVRPLMFAVVPVFAFFVVWDVFAIARGHWYFNEYYMTRLRVGIVPIEEITFFFVIPLIAILTWENIKIILKT